MYTRSRCYFICSNCRFVIYPSGIKGQSYCKVGEKRCNTEHFVMALKGDTLRLCDDGCADYAIRSGIASCGFANKKLGLPVGIKIKGGNYGNDKSNRKE